MNVVAESLVSAAGGVERTADAADVRSGEAPGLSGGPVEAFLVVVLIGVITVAVTVVYARIRG